MPYEPTHMARKIKELPGMTGKGVEAPIQIAELDDLAEKYVIERDKRLKMTPREVAAKDALREGMHRHEGKLTRNAEGFLIYRFDEQEVIMKPGKEQVQVKAVHIVEHEV
jgi:hypothetical protein